jgi:uridylate kinase
MSILSYERILLKVSGEALAGPKGTGFDPETISIISRDIIQAKKIEQTTNMSSIVIVVGGGNFARGAELAQLGMDRPTADMIGMLGTVKNALALENALKDLGQPAVTMSALSMPSVCETYTRIKAESYLSEGKIVICAGGTGNPFFSTDTTASLRAAELKCDVILKATNVDGIYSADPKKDPNATHFARLTHEECIAKDLKVMDTAAFALARENNIPILVFSLQNDKAIETVLKGEGKFTLVTGDKNG